VQQPHFVAQRAQLARPVVRSAAGLDAHQAPRPVRYTATNPARFEKLGR
jgi:hypothetical protein